MSTLLTPTPTEDLEQSASPSYGTASFLRYLAIVLAGSLLLLLLAFPFARTSFFMQISQRVFWHSMQHQTEMGGQNCAVVVFGDSTGLTGIDPIAVEHATGLKTCVLSLPYMALSTTGDQILDDYLAHNQAPELILFANHARHLRTPELDEQPGVIDGWLLADRILPVGKAVRFFASHPRSTFLFIESVWQQAFTLSFDQQPDFTRRTYWRDQGIMRENNGYFPYKTYLSEQEICSEYMPAPTYDPDYLPRLIKRYQRGGTKVALYASPIRACDPNKAIYNQITDKLGIPAPTPYPISDFADAYHLNPQGAAKNTGQVIDFIRNKLHLPAVGSSSTVGD